VVHLAPIEIAPAGAMSARPNPFVYATILGYELSSTDNIALTIHDLTGRRLFALDGGLQDPGEHEVVWDGTDGAGGPLPAGAYWAVVSSTGWLGETRATELVFRE
jgi:flagellar hook assembly protein FlgD